MRVWIFNHLTYEFSSNFSTIYGIIFPASKVWITGWVFQPEIQWNFIPLSLCCNYLLTYKSFQPTLNTSHDECWTSKSCHITPHQCSTSSSGSDNHIWQCCLALHLTSLPPPSPLHQPPPLPHSHPLPPQTTPQIAANEPLGPNDNRCCLGPR